MTILRLNQQAQIMQVKIVTDFLLNLLVDSGRKMNLSVDKGFFIVGRTGDSFRIARMKLPDELEARLLKEFWDEPKIIIP